MKILIDNLRQLSFSHSWAVCSFDSLPSFPHFLNSWAIFFLWWWRANWSSLDLNLEFPRSMSYFSGALGTPLPISWIKYYGISPHALGKSFQLNVYSWIRWRGLYFLPHLLLSFRGSDNSWRMYVPVIPSPHQIVCIK